MNRRRRYERILRSYSIISRIILVKINWKKKKNENWKFLNKINKKFLWTFTNSNYFSSFDIWFSSFETFTSKFFSHRCNVVVSNVWQRISVKASRLFILSFLRNRALTRSQIATRATYRRWIFAKVTTRVWFQDVSISIAVAFCNRRSIVLRKNMRIKR
jgi:hypothetical protein